MGKPEISSVKPKWPILTVALVIAMISIVIAFWSGIFFHNPGKVQKLYFISCEWSEDSSVDNPCILLSIANTGADELIVSNVWINGTLLDSAEWESFPSMRFQPGDQGVIQMIPSLEILKQGTTYQFTIQALAGNSFSHAAKPESLDFTFMQTEELKIVSRTWGSGYIDLKVRNTGTVSLTLSDAEVNGAAPTGQNATGALAANGQTVVRITNTFVSGQKYEFAILTSAGNRYVYTATAP